MEGESIAPKPPPLVLQGALPLDPTRGWRDQSSNMETMMSVTRLRNMVVVYKGHMTAEDLCSELAHFLGGGHFLIK